MNFLIPLWLIIVISFILNMSGFVLWAEPAITWQRKMFQQIAPSKKERSRLVLFAGVGAFLFGISIGPFFDFLSLTAVNQSISVSDIISRFAFWSPLPILVGIGAAIREYIIIQMQERINRNI